MEEDQTSAFSHFGQLCSSSYGNNSNIRKEVEVHLTFSIFDREDLFPWKNVLPDPVAGSNREEICVQRRINPLAYRNKNPRCLWTIWSVARLRFI